MFSGLIKSSGPSFEINRVASSAPLSCESPASSHRRASSEQVIAAPPAAIASSPSPSAQCSMSSAVAANCPPPSPAVGARQAIDQPDLAAAIRRNIGAVHPVDDACQHKARLTRIKQRAIEQLKIERRLRRRWFRSRDWRYGWRHSDRTHRRSPCEPAPSTAARTNHRWSGAHRPTSRARSCGPSRIFRRRVRARQ